MTMAAIKAAAELVALPKVLDLLEQLANEWLRQSDVPESDQNGWTEARHHSALELLGAINRLPERS